MTALTAAQFVRLSALNARGERRNLADLAQGQPAVFVFVRHFGCMLCQEQVADLLLLKPELDARDAKLIVVGCGEPDEARKFAAAMGLSDDAVLTDPTRAVYQDMGFKRGVRTALNRGTVSSSVRAYRKGHRQKRTQGDPWQQGGMLVVDRQGLPTYVYVSEFGGDHPPQAAVLRAVDVARDDPTGPPGLAAVLGT